MPYRTDVHQSRLWRRVDEDVEIATFLVVASKHGAEDASIANMMRGDDASHLLTMETKGFRGFHFSLRRINSGINVLLNRVSHH